MDFMIVLVRVKCVEIRDAIGAENDRFAVEDEVLLAALRAASKDPWITAGPIVASARDQAHAVSIALQAEAVAIVFYFMKPIEAVRDRNALRRQAELKGMRHRAQISIRRRTSMEQPQSSFRS
jgi:hypothetical protein